MFQLSGLAEGTLQCFISKNMGSVGFESKSGETTDDGISVEHFGSFKDLGSRISSFHEVDGVLGKFVGLVDVLFENDVVAASFKKHLHILLS